MRRRIFNLLSAISLLFAAAVLPLWLRSYWVRDGIEYRRGRVVGQDYFQRGWAVESDYGVFAIGSWWGRTINIPSDFQDRLAGLNWTASRSSSFDLRDCGIPHVFDFGLGSFERKAVNYTGRSGGLLLPYWSLTLIFCISPSIWLLRWRGDRICRRR